MIGRTVSHYKILEQLGQGGMGVVYKALDTKLNRTVALKFLPQDLTREQETIGRFINEAQAASALDHVNICTVHEINETEDGQMYIVMAYYAGETLEKKVTSGQLSVDNAIDIAMQTAQGLERAHEAGIVHRDIKPSNLIITPRGEVKIIDFGLAKLTGQSRLTKSGSALGTVAYMSPEQVQGKPVDQRADIWSLGVVLHEMLTGQLPFRGENEAVTMYSIMNEEPKPIIPTRSGRTGVPMELERIVNKAISKKSGERYQSMNEILADLRLLQKEIESGVLKKHPIKATLRKIKRSHLRGVVAGLLVLIIAVGLYLILGRSETINSIAVLPFANIGADPNTEYLSDGITVSLINSLLQLPKLHVKARSVVFRYKGREVDPQTVGRDLQVEVVLMGRAIQRGDNLNLQVELVEVASGSQLWGEQYNRKLTDLLVVQEEITKEISARLRLKLRGEEMKRLTKRYTDNPEAYQLYLKGRYFWEKRTAEDLKKAIGYFEQAIGLDPHYALAYAGIALCHGPLGVLGYLPPWETAPKMKAAAIKALEIDDTLAEAYAALATLKAFYEWDWAGAERAFKRALELNPNYASAHLWYGLYLDALGRHEESIAEKKRAQELEPLSLIINAGIGFSFYLAREYDQAIAAQRKTLELDPNFFLEHSNLGLAYEAQGMYEKAIAEHQKAVAFSGGAILTLASLGHAYAVSGKRAEAQKILDELHELSKQRYVSPFRIAIIYKGLGKKDQAFAWLEKAYEERDPALNHVKVEPRCDSLRSDPRFTALLKKMRLEN